LVVCQVFFVFFVTLAIFPSTTANIPSVNRCKDPDNAFYNSVRLGCLPRLFTGG
jgi:hypothetical protein